MKSKIILIFAYVFLALTLVFVAASGWVFAHFAVANECEKLGGFYVGETVYECKIKGGAS